jgi:hypothetical protein
MSREPLAAAAPRGRRRPVFVLGVLGLLLAAALAGGWVYQKARADLAGLEGTWREQGDSMHTFRFRANGDVDVRYQGFLMGTFMTWRRHGRQVSIHSARRSDFVGQLGDGEIRGRETVYDNAGKAVRTVDRVWRRE